MGSSWWSWTYKLLIRNNIDSKLSIVETYFDNMSYFSDQEDWYGKKNNCIVIDSYQFTEFSDETCSREKMLVDDINDINTIKEERYNEVILPYWETLIENPRIVDRLIGNMNYQLEKQIELTTKEVATEVANSPELKKTWSGFHIIEESPDDIVLYQKDKKILFIALPEQATQWNTALP